MKTMCAIVYVFVFACCMFVFLCEFFVVFCVFLCLFVCVCMFLCVFCVFFDSVNCSWRQGVTCQIAKY